MAMRQPRQQDEGRIRECDVQGLGYFRKLRPLFERLHDVGCTRDRAGNRQLHFDQQVVCVIGRVPSSPRDALLQDGSRD